MKANITVYSKQVHVTQVACQCINNMHMITILFIVWDIWQ